MSYLADKRKEHEQACDDAIHRKDYSKAKFHAAKTGEFSFKLAEQTEGKVAKCYVKDAFEWIEIGEQLAKHKTEPSSEKARKVADTVNEDREIEHQTEWLVTEKPNVSLMVCVLT